MKPIGLVYNESLSGQRMSHKHDKDLNRLRELPPSMREKPVHINLNIFMSKISKHQRKMYIVDTALIGHDSVKLASR